MVFMKMKESGGNSFSSGLAETSPVSWFSSSLDSLASGSWFSHFHLLEYQSSPSFISSEKALILHGLFQLFQADRRERRSRGRVVFLFPLTHVFLSFFHRPRRVFKAACSLSLFLSFSSVVLEFSWSDHDGTDFVSFLHFMLTSFALRERFLVGDQNYWSVLWMDRVFRDSVSSGWESLPKVKSVPSTFNQSPQSDILNRIESTR